MARWLYFLLLALPAALIAEAVHAPHLVTFILAAIGLIPLAGLIGVATEALAERLGHRIGGLLNATFGNAAEIIIGIVALTAGLPEVVRSSLSGSIIGNILLVQGFAMLIGGWKHLRQKFSARTAGQYAIMLIVSVIGMAIPTLLATVGEGARPGDLVVKGSQLHQVSIGVSIVLLLCYAAYIAYSIFGLRAHPDDVAQMESGASAEAEVQDAAHTANETQTKSSTQNEVQRAAHTANETQTKSSTQNTAEVQAKSITHKQPAASGPLAQWHHFWHNTYWLPIAVLAVATALTALASELLVGTIDPLTKEIGLNPFFVGLIIIPLVGNAAEHFTAVTAAARNHMEISTAITAGSSIQIALLAAPILVIIGALIGTPLDLNFTILEVAMFALAAGLFAFICIDGESNWLEGFLLLAFYVLLAVGTFISPL